MRADRTRLRVLLAVPRPGRAAGRGPGGPRRPGPARQVATGADDRPATAGRRRWDGDERGVGVAAAVTWRPLAETIARFTAQPGWVAEDPEQHLLPHLEAAAADSPLAIRWTSTDADGAFVVELEWTAPEPPSRRSLRGALFGLIAPIAETITVVHEPPAARGHVLEIMTGSGDGTGRFAAHGHTVRLVVAEPNGLAE